MSRPDADAGARRLPFGDDVVEAVLAHMRDDHASDGVVIVRRHGAPGATAALMLGFDALETTWSVTDADGVEGVLTVPWPAPITDRASVRRQVVELFDGR